MGGLSNERVTLYKCTLDGNTFKSINPADSLPPRQLIRDPSRPHRSSLLAKKSRVFNRNGAADLIRGVYVIKPELTLVDTHDQEGIGKTPRRKRS